MPAALGFESVFWGGLACRSTASCIDVGVGFPGGDSSEVSLVAEWNGKVWGENTPDETSDTYSNVFWGPSSCTTALGCPRPREQCGRGRWAVLAGAVSETVDRDPVDRISRTERYNDLSGRSDPARRSLLRRDDMHCRRIHRFEPGANADRALHVARQLIAVPSWRSLR